MSDGPKTRVIHLRRRRSDAEELMGTLAVLEGPGVGRFFVMEPKVDFTMGRAEDCEASFPHPSVSRRHATIEVAVQDGRLRARLRDLDSTNGVRVNRRLAAEHLLVSGDKIILGRVVLRFEWMNEEEVAYHRRVADDHRVAIRDPLSGLFTRGFLDDRLPKLLAEADEDAGPISCLLLDLDWFKAINDTHGHLVGDEVIVGVSRIVRDGLRRSDFAIRYGGEEILCILPSTSAPVALEVAERLRKAIEIGPKERPGHGIDVTASFGVGERKRGEPAREWIGRTDAALFEAKRAGRNRVAEASDRHHRSFDTEPDGPTAEQFLADLCDTEESLPSGDAPPAGEPRVDPHSNEFDTD
jgi:diguanylate cyclase (GGDEF)-like protein